MIQSFWGRMRTGLLNRKSWRTHLELANVLFEDLEIFHNANADVPRSAYSPRPSTNSAPSN